MAERNGRIKEYHATNRQGVIQPDDGGPEVRFYRNVVSDQALEPHAGFLVTFDAPPSRMNKKREPVQDPASAVTITDTSHPVEQPRYEPDKRGGKKFGGRRGARREFRPRPAQAGGADERREPRPGREPRGERPSRPRRDQAGMSAAAPSAEGARVHRARRTVSAGSPRPVPRNSVRPRLERRVERKVGGRFLRPMALDIRNIIVELSGCAISPSLLLDKYLRSLPPAKVAPVPEEKLIKNRAEQEALNFLKTSFLTGYRGCWENRTAWAGIRRRQGALLRNILLSGYQLIKLVMQNGQAFQIYSTHPSLLGQVGVELERIYGYPLVPGLFLEAMLQAHLAGHLETMDEELRPKIEALVAAPDFAGQVVFLDAIPSAPPIIEVQKAGVTPFAFGASAKAPVEAPPLSIKAGAKFVFSLVYASSLESGVAGVLRQAMQAMLEERGFSIWVKPERPTKKPPAPAPDEKLPESPTPASLPASQ